MCRCDERKRGLNRGVKRAKLSWQLTGLRGGRRCRRGGRLSRKAKGDCLKRAFTNLSNSPRRTRSRRTPGKNRGGQRQQQRRIDRRIWGFRLGQGQGGVDKREGGRGTTTGQVEITILSDKSGMTRGVLH